MLCSFARVRAGLGFVAATCLAFLAPVGATGQTGPLQITPTLLNFGSQPTASSATQSVTLVNTSGSPVAIATTFQQGGSNGQFTLGGTCNGSVAASSNCSVTVTYTPVQLALASDTLLVQGGGSTLNVAVSGTGVQGSTGPVTLLPSALTLISRNQPYLVTLKNTSSLPLGITAIKLDSASFTEVDSCGGQLAAGASCPIYVTASAAGIPTGHLTVQSGDTTDAQTVSLTTLGGFTGVLNFGYIVYGSYSYYTKLGQQGSVGYTGPDNLNYYYSSNYVTVAENFNGGVTGQFYGDSCSVKAEYGPPIGCSAYTEFDGYPEGLNEGTSTYSSGQYYQLKGYGIYTIDDFMTTPSLSTVLAPVMVGSSSALPITVTDLSTSSITISSATLSTGTLNTGDFTLSNACTTLTGSNPPYTCGMSVTFTPKSVGTRQTTLTITDSASKVHTLLITGTGTGQAPTLAATTDFGYVVMGRTSSVGVSVTVPSGNYVSAAVAGTGFSVSPSGCQPSGGSCTFVVVFAPTASQAYTGTLTVTDLTTGATGTSALTGQGTAGDAALSFSPATLTFPATELNTTATMTATLSNTGLGAAALYYGSYVAGTNGSEITPSGTCPSPLNAGASCTFTFTFKPTAAGAANASYQEGNSSPSSPTILTINATGTSSKPGFTFSPSPLAFGAVTAGTTSSPQTVTITNSGASYADITAVTTGKDFAGSNTCTTRLQPGDSCTASITFKPSLYGPESASLTVTTSAGVTGVDSLTGSGGSNGTPSLTFTPATLAFPVTGVGSTATLPVTLQNTGAAAVPINYQTLVPGANGSEFSYTGSCPTPLAIGASCTYTVTFKPTVSNAATTTLTVNTQAPDSPTNLVITGNTSATTPPTFNPTSVTFPNTPVGTNSNPIPVTLTNPSSSAVTITSSVISGTNANSFGTTNTCGSTLAANSSCSYNVAFFPPVNGSAGSYAASLVVTTSAGTATLPLSGTALATTLQFTPASLSFGSVAVGTTSTLTGTLTNNSASAVSVSYFTLTQGTNGTEFQDTPNCPPSLAAGASCTVTVTFTPTVSGAANATLGILNGSSQSPINVPLTGTGAGPVLTLSPASVSFPAQAAGTTSAGVTSTLTNNGSTALSITGAQLVGNNPTSFSFTSGCGSTLAAGASCPYTVYFTPVAASTLFSASLVVTTSAGSIALPVSGAGAAPSTGPALTFTPASLIFPSQLTGTSSVMTATLTNTSGAAVTLAFDSLATGGMGGGSVPFRYTGYCPSPLAAGASCTFTVTFAPTAPGTLTNTLLVGTATQGTFQLPISGTATAPVATGSALTFTPASLAFPAQAAGTSAVMSATVTNTSGGPVALGFDSLATGGNGGGSVPFSYTGSCPTPLAAGASCTFNVTFAPATAGDVTNTLLIGTTSPQGMFQLPISGTGLAAAPAGPALAFMPATLAFPAQTVGTSSTLTATVTNTTSTPVTVGFDSLATGGNGGGSVPFSYTGSCPSPLPAGASCTFNVTFAPTSAGDASNMLLLGTSAGTFSLQLSGTGVAAAPTGPALTFTPASLAFQSQAVGTSNTLSATVTNTSSAPVTLTFDSLATGGNGGGSVPFSYTGSCPNPLAVGAVCTFNITFTPNAPGSVTDMLMIGTTVQRDAFTLPIAGTGVAAAQAAARPSPDRPANLLRRSASLSILSDH